MFSAYATKQSQNELRSSCVKRYACNLPKSECIYCLKGNAMKGFVIKYQEKDSSEIKGFHALYENEQEARESSDRKGWKVLSIEPEVAQRVPYNPDNCNFAYRPQW